MILPTAILMGRLHAPDQDPYPSGQVSVKKAAFFMIALCLIGLWVLLQFDWFAVYLGFSSLLIVLIYPFMKRWTNWPQAVLGLAFGWGALMGWASMRDMIELPALLLYAGTISWIIGYDTIYAHQDREDDALIGMKSTALRFGESTKTWLSRVFWIGDHFAVQLGCDAGSQQTSV